VKTPKPSLKPFFLVTLPTFLFFGAILVIRVIQIS
jgi:hypothetical protein